jgi:uncharacterized membrane protein (DUF373 family)
MPVAGSEARPDDVLVRYIGRIESAIYLLAALFLVLMAAASFFIVAVDMAQLIPNGLTIGVIYSSLNDLLVILIIVELIQTIVVFLRSHQLDLRLIMAAGLTAMIRRVLVFGVEKVPVEEMAVTAALLLVLVIAIYLIGDRKVDIGE